MPAKYDSATGQTTRDDGAVYVTKPYWGDRAFCNEIPDGKRLFKCLAIHARTRSSTWLRHTK